jgi:hypothetical protein
VPKHGRPKELKSLTPERRSKLKEKESIPFTGKFPKIKLTLRPIDVLAQKNPSA